MLTSRENLLETVKKDGCPDRLPVCFTPFVPIGGDPVFQFTRGNRVRGSVSVDRWGTVISFPEDAPGAVPIINRENAVIKDIEHWRDYVKVPDLEANCSSGWETAQSNKEKIPADKLSMVIMGTGIFEQLHMLMPFDDALCALLEYPDEVQELIDVICEYRLSYMRLIVEHLHPDAILSHDDWGTQTQTFMSPDLWREFFKEPYRKLYSYLHENNVLVIHHSDSYCEPLVPDMADIGIDIWQGVIPTNDIVGISERMDGRIALMGGFSSSIDRKDAGEEEIRSEARRALREYGHLKHFIPSYTYGGPGTIFPQVQPILEEEIDAYNLKHFGICREK